MAKTQAERAKKYRDAKRDATVTKVERDAPGVTGPYAKHVTDVVLKHDPIGPLDVYSPARWEFLQSRDYTWDAARQRGIRAVGAVVGVAETVPGDPAYQAAPEPTPCP